MDARLANTWRLTVNEKKFIEAALVSGIRVDGRNPYEYRKLSIKFGRQVLALSHTEMHARIHTYLCAIWFLGVCDNML